MIDIIEYKLNAKKFRLITKFEDEMYAETVTSAVEKFLSYGEVDPENPAIIKTCTPQTIEFLIDAGVLVKKTN